MWQYKYKNIDRNNLRPEIKVTVFFTNGTDSFEKEYEVLPIDLKTETFTGLLEEQVNLLNEKDTVIENVDIIVEKIDSSLVDKEIII